MAKYERIFRGDFDTVLTTIHNGILRESISAEYEDGSDIEPADSGVRCAVRVYERYSYLGQNRVSLNVTLVGAGERLLLSAIAAGGSQAMFMKINTIGEGDFLDTLIEVVEPIAQAAPDTDQVPGVNSRP
ncbi:DUF6054 family protein [Gordonia zhaorongruii]|uniref:DUF6054 family protein n=1 Tax=Gordonia zhaorongruii TaxID=2597659 RepID=UPI00104FAC3E|nr:DUF6054 family protein [Gordonia zhaorongruii]